MNNHNNNSIAAVVLTNNEEQNIGDCLKSLEWANELIVCDSGSTDNTVEIARNNGATVHVKVPERDFIVGEQRNWVVARCIRNSEWVLFIDADEIVTEKLKTEIIETVANPQGKVGFRLCPKYMFMGRWLKHVMRFPAWHDRLMKRGEIKCAQGGMLDHFDCAPEKMGLIHEPYLHYSFNKGFFAWVEKHNRYSSFMAERFWQARRRPVEWKELFRVQDPDPRRWRRAVETMFRGFPAAYPWCHLFYVYIIKRGFLDGLPGFIYSLMLFNYTCSIWIKIREIKLKQQGRAL